MKPIEWVVQHSAKWGSRIKCLREARTDCLEAGIWISATVLFTLFALKCSFGPLVYMTHQLPRWAWLVMTGFLSLLSLFGYLENVMLMRRLGGFFSFLFWLITGIVLFHKFPYAALLHLGEATLWSWVWTRVGQHEIKEWVAALPPAEVKSLAEQCRLAEGQGRVVKMPRR